ncbi:MAG: hypothetical protein JSS49_28875 [Planctomycetes bacterium]|nr:hypothetical protein [Planctomycetota bacterium]
MTHIELTEDEFDSMFTFVRNHLNRSASWAYGEGPGCLFETYGEEFDFVRGYDPSKVWTLADGDDGDLYVVNGLHFVNRIGYLLSHECAPENTTVEVHIPMLSNDDDCEDNL